MNRYTVYVANNRKATERKVFAASSFEARKECAKENGVAVTDCVAIRDRGGV
jgi:hypothetical protein